MFITGSYLVRKALSGFDTLQSNLQRGVQLIQQETSAHEAEIAEKQVKHNLFLDEKREDILALARLQDDAERALRGISRLLKGE